MSRMPEYDRARAMKQTDIKPCIGCGRGVMAAGSILFLRLTVERLGVDLNAVKRQTGLEQFMGGTAWGAKIANVMGPDEDMAIPIGDAVTGLVCAECADKHPLDVLYGLALEAHEKQKGEGDGR